LTLLLSILPCFCLVYYSADPSPFRSFQSVQPFCRRFVDGNKKTSEKSSTNDIRVIDYNVLGDLSHAPPLIVDGTEISSETRFTRTVQELLSYDADVINLQEVQVPFAHDFLLPNFPPSEWFYLYSFRQSHRQVKGLDLPTLNLLSLAGGDLILVKKSSFNVTLSFFSFFLSFFFFLFFFLPLP
jgi:hypothetical protein